MRIAITQWGARVSPAFDTARVLLLVDLNAGEERGRFQASLEGLDLGARVRRLVQLGVDLLICGAVSRSAQARLAARGIAVRPEVCGLWEEALAAWRGGSLQQGRFYARGAPPAEPGAPLPGPPDQGAAA
jgi:predicted Fe-Mo cluster-binding NifX family protein